MGRLRLLAGLESIVAALAHNTVELKALAAVFGQDRVPFGASLDISAWEESRDEVVPVLRSPDLQRRVAWHFSKVRSLISLKFLYVELALGESPSSNVLSMGSQDLRAYLTKEVQRLLVESETLKAQLEQLITDGA